MLLSQISLNFHFFTKFLSNSSTIGYTLVAGVYPIVVSVYSLFTGGYPIVASVYLIVISGYSLVASVYRPVAGEYLIVSSEYTPASGGYSTFCGFGAISLGILTI